MIIISSPNFRKLTLSLTTTLNSYYFNDSISACIHLVGGRGGGEGSHLECYIEHLREGINYRAFSVINEPIGRQRDCIH